MRNNTLCLLKPASLTNGINWLSVIFFIKRKGFAIGEYKWCEFSEEDAESFFPDTEDWLSAVGRKVLDSCNDENVDPLTIFETSNPIKLGLEVRRWNVVSYTGKIMLALRITSLDSGDVIKRFRDVQGHTDPKKASFGTIRKVFSSPNESGFLATLQRRPIENIVHSPDSEERFNIEWDVIKKAKEWVLEPSLESLL